MEATGEAQEKLHVTKNKGGIVVKGIHDVAVRFQSAAVRSLETKSLDLLQGDGELPFIVQIV